MDYVIHIIQQRLLIVESESYLIILLIHQFILIYCKAYRTWRGVIIFCNIQIVIRFFISDMQISSSPKQTIVIFKNHEMAKLSTLLKGSVEFVSDVLVNVYLFSSKK